VSRQPSATPLEPDLGPAPVVDVPTPPDRLYSADDLFGAWEPDRPASAAETFDFRSYAQARAHGLRMPTDREVAAARARHDTAVSWELHEELAGRRAVAIMGGHSMARNDPGYRLVAELALALAGNGFLLLSGGGPGAMEATHLGARCAGSSLGLGDALTMMGADEPGPGDDAPPDDRLVFPFRSAEELFGAGGAVIADQVARLHAWQAPAFAVAAASAGDAGESIGIPTWMYGTEPPTPLATSLAKYFDNSIREDGLLALAADGVVFAPGHAGTLQEIFQDAAQNAYRTVANRFSPMVFLDLDEHWSVHFGVRQVLERLFDDTEERQLHWVDNVADAVAALG
jgi:predicted Rossmann-fold nucleotide-binding protein